jgi:hypothetical protein
MKKIVLFFLLTLLVPIALLAQSIPTPKEHFGFTIGDPYMLANFTQTEAYFRKWLSFPIEWNTEASGKLSLGVSNPS